MKHNKNKRGKIRIYLFLLNNVSTTLIHGIIQITCTTPHMRYLDPLSHRHVASPGDLPEHAVPLWTNGTFLNPQPRHYPSLVHGTADTLLGISLWKAVSP